MIRRILVPLDGSSRAERILPHMRAVAKVFDARLDLLHIVSGQALHCGRATVDPFGTRMVRAERGRYLERKAEELRDVGVRVWTSVEEGGAAAVMVGLLRKGEYDLIGLTPHGTGDDPHLGIGCTALAVIMNARVGIFLAPEECPSPPSRMTDVAYGSVLAPVDCSPRSDWTLGFAAALARGAGARLSVVHVVDRPQVLSRLPGSGRVGDLANRVREENRLEAKRYLDEVHWRFKGSDVSIDCRIIEGGSGPAEAVLDLVRTEEVGLVVLSAHGGGHRSSWPVGGTAAKILLQSPLPVLVLQDVPVERFRPQRVSRTIRALAGDQ
ncbi:MAG: universal stress protein [Gemmatimonadota bacterium]